MKGHLSRFLWQLRALTGSAAQRRLEQAGQEITRLKAENTQLTKQRLLNQLEANTVATYKATIAEQQVQIERLQRELAEARDDLDIARSQAARSAASTAPPPVIIDMSDVAEPYVPPPPTMSPSSTSTSDWYAAWQLVLRPRWRRGVSAFFNCAAFR
jgi:septal ring factor EnvC (AmiA/AmiB activator)